MPDYARLREYVSHRVAFDYENGVKVVGYVGQTRPPLGPVQTVMLSAALLYAPDGKLVRRLEQTSLVPNLLVNVQKDGSRMTLDFDTGARIVGSPRDDELAAAGFVTLEGVAIHDSNGRVLERHGELPVVPRTLVRYRLDEGPLGV
jgi:hypothetical protein